MTWNKWLVFTKSVIMGLNNISPWPCPLGVVYLPCVITWLYSTPLLFVQAVGVVVQWMSLASYGVLPWLETHMPLCSIRYFLSLTLFSTFCSLFHTMANISIFLSHRHCHINFYFPFSQFMCRCKDWNACKNLVIVLYRVSKRDNSKQNQYEYCEF